MGLPDWSESSLLFPDQARRAVRRVYSYRALLPTTKDELTEAVVPLADFIHTAFGRRVQRMGPVKPSQIIGLCLMLNDKKPVSSRCRSNRELCSMPNKAASQGSIVAAVTTNSTLQAFPRPTCTMARTGG